MTTQLELYELKRPWLEDSVRGFDDIASILGDFTCDKLHAFFPAPAHDNWWGVLCATLAKQGRIERVGAKPSNRPEANGRLVSVWRVKQKD